MIDSPLLYLLSIVVPVLAIRTLEAGTRWKLFQWLPAVVIIYALALLGSQTGVWADNAALTDAYAQLKRWMLPMLLFLMVSQIDLRRFAAMGPPLIAAYAAAVFSLALAFITVFALFGFTRHDAGVFGALAGSWTGGTANMLAVAGAQQITEAQLGPALAVDALLYSLWVMALLMLVPFAKRFDRWSRAEDLNTDETLEDRRPLTGISVVISGVAALLAAFVSLQGAEYLGGLSLTTWTVLLASLLGLLASLTPLRRCGATAPMAGGMLYLLVGLIGSHATPVAFARMGDYLAAATLILLLHAAVMVLLARVLRLNLFTIAVASLANIGGVASAPILASAYHRNLVGIAVVMAITGYLVGTFVGLMTASAMAMIAP